jgi:hypothetical protein
MAEKQQRSRKDRKPDTAAKLDKPDTPSDPPVRRMLDALDRIIFTANQAKRARDECLAMARDRRRG